MEYLFEGFELEYFHRIKNYKNIIGTQKLHEMQEIEIKNFLIYNTRRYSYYSYYKVFPLNSNFVSCSMSNYQNSYLFQGRSFLPSNSLFLHSAHFILQQRSYKLVCFYHRMPVSFRSFSYSLFSWNKCGINPVPSTRIKSYICIYIDRWF